MKKITFLLLFISSFGAISIANAQSGIITTVAGNGTAGYWGDGLQATVSKLNAPQSIALDGLGNLYIADLHNNRIRMVNNLGIITTVAGTGTFGFTGDGGPATSAELNAPISIASDGVGNLYIADNTNFRIRKVNTLGIITTIAGNGTVGYSGDGGVATASTLNNPTSVTIDVVGNVYIADLGNNRIRKINTSGIISTIAGNGSSSYSGEGTNATAAGISPYSLAIDGIGNIYIADYYNNRIRKVNSSGIITTIAGNGMAGSGGDGGLAIFAQLSNPSGVVVDKVGNVYIADGSNNRIRKVNLLGIITTIAGNGIPGFSGDGSMATLAKLSNPVGLAFDSTENLYIADCSNNRIRKTIITHTHTADSFFVNVNNNCGSLLFEIFTNNFSAGQHLKTSFGNGTYWDTAISVSSMFGTVSFQQQYAFSGIYTIKHILYNSTVPVDSITYIQSVQLCQNLEIGFYNNILGSCTFNDSTDRLVSLPILVEVDSNSIPIDTVSATSGLYYTSYGNVGDIYSFRVINCPSGIYVTCPATGIISDTLFTGVNATKYFGFNCATSTAFDLKETMGASAGRHMQELNINVSGAYCLPVDAILTLNFSPKYVFESAIPPPTSFGGNTAIWDLSAFSYLYSPKNINVMFNVPGTWLIPGDTVITNCTITPTAGDIDTTNNYCVRVDTVKSSFDPNEMAVMPSGCIPATVATPLVYTLLFENTGNDTAHNIYVLDTLPGYVVPNSLRIISASNIMNTSKWYDTTIHRTIYKFEFPNINLLDSSHHNQCSGMVVYSLNTLAGMPSGTIITNRAGIYFDDNPVVMTNSAINVAGCALSTSTPKTIQSFNLYPNPATNQLTIKAEVGNYHTLTITGIVGHQILQQSITAQETIVDVQQLPSGIYYITLSGEKGSEVRKFVKW